MFFCCYNNDQIDSNSVARNDNNIISIAVHDPLSFYTSYDEKEDEEDKDNDTDSLTVYYIFCVGNTDIDKEDEEDALVEDMDDAWWAMTEEEIDNFEKIKKSKS